MNKSMSQARSNWVTQQHDARRVYQKRRMPYAKKKRWISFKRKVDHVLNNAHGIKTVLFNDQGNISSVEPDGQLAIFGCLYGCGNGLDTGDEVGFGDLGKLDDLGLYPDASKVRFTSAVFDMTVTNSSTRVMEIDVYEYTVGKRVTSGNSLRDTFLIPTATIGTGTALTIQTRGVTPFDMTHAIQKEGLKIQSKRKYYTSPGNAFNYQIRDPKDREFMWSDANRSGWSKSYMSRGVIIIGKLIPGGDPEEETLQMSWGCTRKFGYRLVQDSIMQGASTT